MATLSAYMQSNRWARVVSDVLSPPAVWGALIIPVALQFSESASQGLGWALLYGFWICLLPVLFIAYMVWMGKIGDIHMQKREERYKPLFVSISCTLAAWLLLKVLNAPLVFSLLAVISLVQIIIMALITLYWQISMHAMGITGATMAIGIFFSVQVALLTVPLIIVVGMARLVLKRHTPAQIFAGAMVGALVPLLVLIVLPNLLPSML